MSSNRRPSTGVTRRSFLAGVSAAAATTPSLLSSSPPAEQPTLARGSRIQGPGPVPVQLEVNGVRRKALVEARTTLLDLLRDQLQVTGPKEVCDMGACGACTVDLDGRTVNACMTLALECEGASVRTVEGLGSAQDLHPLQAAFVADDALQCGYCTPGMLMSAEAILSRNPRASLEEIQKGLSGNLCRCGTYTNVFKACKKAGRVMDRGGDK